MAQERSLRDVEWQTNYHAGLELATEQTKPVLIDFYADWCGPCKMMDAQVYSDPQVVAALNAFVSVKVDIDRNQKTAFAYGISSIPRTVVLNVHREMVGDIVGFMDRDQFLKFLSDVQEYTNKKTGGIVVSVPEGGAGSGPSLPEIAPDTELSKLLEYASDKQPDRRDQARQAIAARDNSEVRKILAQALANEYLGMRIGAWETLRMLDAAPEDAYNPWASKTERDSAARRVLEHVASVTADKN